LWFGDELHSWLINSHQIRSHGYGVCDDPRDPHRPLGIDLESIFIPLTVSGPNLSLEKPVPSLWEIDNLLIIEITSPTWNPADLQMPGPQLTPTRAVKYISTAWQDIWSLLTAPLSQCMTSGPVGRSRPQFRPAVARSLCLGRPRPGHNFFVVAAAGCGPFVPAFMAYDT
jgi:hypothetical protein